MKKRSLIVFVGLLIVAIAAAGAFAAWTSVNHANNNVYQAATFGMSIGLTGTDTVNGACNFTNMAPGDDPVTCKIYLRNDGSIPINIVWSGFTLTGDEVMKDNVYVVGFADSNNQTNISDIGGVQTIRSAAAKLANGYFSDPNNTRNSTSLFLSPGETGWVSLDLAFGANAGNDTIGKQVGFNWTLTAMQLPKHSNP